MRIAIAVLLVAARRPTGATTPKYAASSPVWSGPTARPPA